MTTDLAKPTGRVTHGCARDTSRTSEYDAWRRIKARCYYRRCLGFHNYGGRGIRVCRRWRTSFAAFLEDVGTKPSPLHTLDRIDPDGHYEPGNVRWATRREQARNRRDNRRLTFRGVTRCLSEWADVLGVKRNTLETRRRLGWSVKDTLLIPLGARTRWSR